MLKGKHAIVTGSTSGIGEGIAKKLAEAGCDILLNGFGDAGEIETLRQSIEKTYGVRCAYSNADLTKTDKIAEMITQARDTFGSVDIIVNNAGIQHVAPIEDFPPEKWELVIALNLSAAFYASRLVVADMRKAGYGRIINIASAHGLVASAQKSAYVAAKHGLVGLTKVIALENAGTGITCNAICPGWVLTPLVQKQIDDKAKAKGCSVKEAELELLSEKQPSKQFVQVDQLGALAVFLSGTDAGQITGSAYSMDGGWTAQ
jgi:3-hydroxybutyrate dehydrogenase